MTEPLALVYDDTDGELVAKVYTAEALDQFKSVWWAHIEEVGDGGGDDEDSLSPIGKALKEKLGGDDDE